MLTRHKTKEHQLACLRFGLNSALINNAGLLGHKTSINPLEDSLMTKKLDELNKKKEYSIEEKIVLARQALNLAKELRETIKNISS